MGWVNEGCCIREGWEGAMELKRRRIRPRMSSTRHGQLRSRRNTDWTGQAFIRLRHDGLLRRYQCVRAVAGWACEA